MRFSPLPPAPRPIDPASCGTIDGTQTETCKYTLSISDVDPDDNNQSFTVTAAPEFDDTECGSFTLTQTGAKGITGSGAVLDCWGR